MPWIFTIRLSPWLKAYALARPDLASAMRAELAELLGKDRCGEDVVRAQEMAAAGWASDRGDNPVAKFYGNST